MTDYQGNSKRVTDKVAKPEKQKLEKVVTEDVVTKKKGLVRKIRDAFVSADIPSVTRYVVHESLIPAVRTMIVDSATQGIERAVFGDAAPRRRGYGVPGQSRITYNSPPGRGVIHEISSRRAPTPTAGPRMSPRGARDDFIIASRKEAEEVLERMNDVVDVYEVVSVADLNDLLGLPTSAVDHKWGWVYVADVQIRQTREGYLLDLPPAEPIQ